MKKGLLAINTGDGKGKTTAALGLIFRALGHGHKVCLIQFLKGSWKYGELESAERFKDLLDVHVLGKGFTWTGTKEEHAEAALKAWEFAKKTISAGKHQLVVLDELTYVVTYGTVPEQEVIDCVVNRPEGMHVVITGRNAPDALVSIADLVTEMKEIKHPYQAGIQAQQGFEY